MKEIIIKTQKELNDLPKSFPEYTKIIIEGGTYYDRIIINVARGNSNVVARENSNVEARGNSNVVAWGNSNVVAWENSSIKIFSKYCSIKKALQESVIIYIGITKLENEPLVVKNNATVLYKNIAKYTKQDFLDIYEENLTADKKKIILYKSVNPKNNTDFQTGKIVYKVGKKIICPDFDSNQNRECGGGLHLSPRIKDALSYNQGKILKCEVGIDDFVVYHSNITKVRCSKVKVIEEVEK